jgi:hypothetical protein
VTRRRVALVSVLLALTSASGACGRADEAPAATRLVVAFTGEDLGRVEPCGCASAMLGGLARRPARIGASAAPGVPFAYVSGGRVVAGADEYDRLRLRAILRALGAMKCAAFAPSRTELALPREALVAAAGAAGVPVVAANADAPSGALVRSVKLGGVEAYATGLVDAAAGASDPAAALRAVRAELPAGAALVVLSDVDADAARALVKDAAGPTLVLYAGGRTEPRAEDATPGAAAIAPYPARGEFVGLARLAGEGASARWTVEYLPVLHDLPEDATVAAQRRTHLAEMRGAEILRKSAGTARFVVGDAPTGDEGYAGNETCADCHVGATKAWGASKHAKAMATLAATGDDVDPGCVKCHVVGYGTGRGFVDPRATPRLADVGCEACHGPRAAHVEARRGGRVDPPRRKAGERSCLACHDAEHDPDFHFATDWPRIVHDGR